MANPTGKGGFQDHPELINKDGAPRKGQTWRESTKRLTDMSRDELVEYVGGRKTRIGRLLASATSDIPIKDAMIIAGVVAFLIDPNPRMLQALSDREDGKPPASVKLSGDVENPLVIRRLGIDIDEV